MQRAVELVRARGAAAQLCVIREGQVVLDIAHGCAPDALFWTFSSGKPLTSVLVHVLAERGMLALDEPVAAHWPEYSANGKHTVTVRQVLRHRSGFATAGSAVGDALAMTSWDRSIRRIERAHLRWPPGAVPAYQFIAQGFVLGELAQRVTGRPLPELLAAELLDPLGMRDTHLGIADQHWPRHVPIRAPGPSGAALAAVVNRRRTRRAVVPSAGISTTARDLARFYLMLLRGGELDGARVLSPATIAHATIPTSEGEIDRHAKVFIRWSDGFQLGGPRLDPAAVGPMGRRSTPRTFGHNGSNCCIGWADPDRQLAFAYVTNRLTGRATDLHHLAAVADTVLAACADA